MSLGYKQTVNASTGERKTVELTPEEAELLELIRASQPPNDGDFSDSDQLTVIAKTLLACIAQVGGLTKAEAKAMFKQKYDIISGN